jgi:subtilase family serine protease
MCGAAFVGWARCDSILRLNTVQTNVDESTGYGPADLQSAYNLVTAASASTTATVAIVDAFDYPNAASDLAVYRAKYGLPPCTVASGCFRKVNQSGQPSPLPATDSSGGWEGEEALDIQMVSAICPNCKIILVEANNNQNVNLGLAVNAAAALGVNAISNSYGGSEFANEVIYDRFFYKHPGIAVTASSGDSGFGAQYPAASPFVTAVGGTSLAKSHNGTDWAEVAWSGAGSGCSAIEAKPPWQHDPDCANRTIADVSAVADPNTGVAVYDSFPMAGAVCTPPNCWWVFGGTSVSSPIIASVYALAGNNAQIVYGSFSYGHTSSLNDVQFGYNGTGAGCSFPSYLCTGRTGYDGPTGNGTPNGTGGF